VQFRRRRFGGGGFYGKEHDFDPTQTEDELGQQKSRKKSPWGEQGANVFEAMREGVPFFERKGNKGVNADRREVSKGTGMRGGRLAQRSRTVVIGARAEGG